MRRLSRSNDKAKICIPIVETSPDQAHQTILQANPLADLIELRVDYLRKPIITTLLNGKEKPFIITNRRAEEGGKYRGNERRRLEVLEEAVDLGVEFVDVEIGTQKPLLQALLTNKKDTQIILSFHDFQKTPSAKELQKLFDHMTRWGGDIIKIVTFAQTWGDNFNVLSLITYARKREQEIVAFCMGEKGKMSRIFSPIMGAAWTYASLRKDKVSAPGQLTANEVKEIWERLR
jgi:3-dehydroquinate dehydratase type I